MTSPVVKLRMADGSTRCIVAMPRQRLPIGCSTVSRLKSRIAEQNFQTRKSSSRPSTKSQSTLRTALCEERGTGN